MKQGKGRDRKVPPLFRMRPAARRRLDKYNHLGYIGRHPDRARPRSSRCIGSAPWAVRESKSWTTPQASPEMVHRTGVIPVAFAHGRRAVSAPIPAPDMQPSREGVSVHSGARQSCVCEPALTVSNFSVQGRTGLLLATPRSFASCRPYPSRPATDAPAPTRCYCGPCHFHRRNRPHSPAGFWRA